MGRSTGRSADRPSRAGRNALDALEERAGAESPAAAHGYQAELLLRALEFIDCLRDQTASGRAQRMAEGDRAAVGIDPRHVRLQRFRPAQDDEANASLISNTSMSSILRPLLASSVRVAGMGPSSINTGSQPTRHVSTTRARGRHPSSRALSAVISSTAAAPSATCEEEPAV